MKIIKHIKYFFIQLFALPYTYDDIPNFQEEYDRQKAILIAERILRGER